MKSAASTIALPTLVGAALGASVLALSVKALALLIAGIAGAMIATSSVAAYYALVATIPVQVDFIGGVTVTKLIVPFAIGIVGFHALIRRGPWPVFTLGPSGYLALIFFCVSILVTLMADGINAFPGEAAKVPVYAGLFFLTLTFVQTPDQFRRLLWVIAISGTVEALITAAQVHYGFVFPGEWRANVGLPSEGGMDGTLDSILQGKVRAEGTTAHPILLASYYLMTIPCTVCLLLTEEHRLKRMFLVGMVALMSYGWYYTFARSSMLGFAVMAVVTTWFYSKAARTLILVGAASVLAGFLSYQAISDSLSVGVQAAESRGLFGDADVNSASGSWQFRIESIVGGWNLLWAHPWLGVGFGQSIWHYTRYLPSWANHPFHPATIHNIFLEVGSELGIVSLVAFLGLWAWGFVCVKRGFRSPVLRPYAVLMCCVLLGQITFLMITPMVREIWLTIPMAITLGYMSRTADS